MLASLIPKLAGFNWKTSDYRPRPSKIGPEQCLRQHVYHALNAPVIAPSDRFHLVLHDSSEHEHLTLGWLESSAFTLSHTQHPISLPLALRWYAHSSHAFLCSLCHQQIPFHTLHGHIDGLVTDLLGTPFLLEHKAINHFSFERYWKGAWPLDYFTQIVIYLRGLHQEGLQVSRAILLMKNKNTSAYLEFGLEYFPGPDVLLVRWKERFDGELSLITFDDSSAKMFSHLYHDAISAFHLVYQAAQQGRLPDRRYLLGEDWQCQYCPYRDRCWATEANHSTDPPEPSVSLDPAQEALVARYETLTQQRRELEREERDLKRTFKLFLKNAGVTEAAGDHYEIRLHTSTTTRLDESLIPLEILQRAKVPQPRETLKITKVARPRVSQPTHSAA